MSKSYVVGKQFSEWIDKHKNNDIAIQQLQEFAVNGDLKEAYKLINPFNEEFKEMSGKTNMKTFISNLNTESTSSIIKSLTPSARENEISSAITPSDHNRGVITEQANKIEKAKGNIENFKLSIKASVNNILHKTNIYHDLKDISLKSGESLNKWLKDKKIDNITSYGHALLLQYIAQQYINHKENMSDGKTAVKFDTYFRNKIKDKNFKAKAADTISNIAISNMIEMSAVFRLF